MKDKHEFSSRANLVDHEGRNEDRDPQEDEQEKAQKKISMEASPGGGLPPISRFANSIALGLTGTPQNINCSIHQQCCQVLTSVHGHIHPQ